MWTTHFVRHQRQSRPDALALADENRELTWRQLDARTDALAAGLLDLGAGPGDRVVVCSRNRAEVMELYLAAGKAGIIVCPVNPTFPAPEVEHIVRNADPVGVVAEDAAIERLDPVLGAGWRMQIGGAQYEALYDTPRRALPPARPDDVFALVHTSATTGKAKGVALTHRAIAAGYTATAAEFGFGPGQVMLYPCPLFHGSMVVPLALLAAGGAVVVQSEFTPQRFLANVRRFRPTSAFLVPSMIRFAMLARAFDAADLSSLREIIFGGAPMPQELLREALRRFGCPVRNSYGLSEGGPIATAVYTLADLGENGGGGTPLDCAGRMLPGCHIEVLDEAGAPVPAGEIGEVCVLGDGTMQGYWRDPEASAAAIRDGWLRTGDLGHMAEDGLIYLVDRRGDVVIRGGQNVYPAEIERVLAAQPGVRDVAVVGAPSEEWGQVPVAFVVAADADAPPQVTALLTACAAELGSYKRPADVRLVEEIPRNAAGKILRKVLKQQLQSATV
jgi:acyl-CoA synthetase (AMP-forming)/AMP-acid ligase II